MAFSLPPHTVTPRNKSVRKLVEGFLGDHEYGLYECPQGIEYCVSVSNDGAGAYKDLFPVAQSIMDKFKVLTMTMNIRFV